MAHASGWVTALPTRDPLATYAPEVAEALRQHAIESAAALPHEVLARLERSVRVSLGTADWETPDRDDPIARFVEQFVTDVSGADLGPVATLLGDQAGAFLQTLWSLDMGTRAAVVLGRLFDSTPSESSGRSAPDASPPGAAFGAFMRCVAALREVDPVTAELVRLRAARFHNCRLCKTLRAVSSIAAGADETLFSAIDHYETSGLEASHKAALRLVDAMIIAPIRVNDELVAQVRAHFTPGQTVELVCRMIRNAFNKVMVATGTDEANVTEGTELYEINPDGSVVYGSAGA